MDDRDNRDNLNCGRTCRNEPNYRSPSKRSFLDDCIREIHYIKGSYMPMVSIEYNEFNIWNKINRLMHPPNMSVHETLLKKVKRRLFWESKKRRRKSQKPQFNDSKLSETWNFNEFRYVIGTRKIPRNFLKEARQNIQNDLCQTGQEQNTQLAASPMSPCSTSKHVQTESALLFKKPKLSKETILSYQYLERIMANDKVSEGSDRSKLYLKELMNISATQRASYDPVSYLIL